MRDYFASEAVFSSAGFSSARRLLHRVGGLLVDEFLLFLGELEDFALKVVRGAAGSLTIFSNADLLYLPAMNVSFWVNSPSPRIFTGH